MGNVFSFELISFDISFIPSFGDNSPSPWPFLTFILVLLGFLIGIIGLVIFFIKKCRPLPRNTHWSPPPSMLVILCIFTFIIVQIEASPGRTHHIKSRNFAQKFGKPIAKATSPAFITALTYFGLDKLVDIFNTQPELAALAIVAVALFGIIVLLAIVKLILVIINIFKSPVNPTAPIELQEVHSTVQEILNRSNPPRVHN